MYILLGVTLLAVVAVGLMSSQSKSASAQLEDARQDASGTSLSDLGRSLEEGYEWLGGLTGLW